MIARRLAVISAGSLLACGCGLVVGLKDWREAPADGDAGTDASSTSACDLGQPFGTPVPIKELNKPFQREGVARLTPDELVVYFGSQRSTDGGARGPSDLFVSTRAQRAEPFGEPVFVAGLQTNDAEFAPSVTGDGLTLYFTTNRSGRFEIWVAARPSTLVSFTSAQPTNLGGGEEESSPYVTADGARIYWVSKRAGRSGVYVADRGSGVARFDNLRAVGGLPSTGDVVAPTLASDERTIYFAAVGPSGRFDTWTATRTTVDGDFGQAAVVAGVSSADDDFPNWISPDGCRLYMHRRTYDPKAPSVETDEDIYLAERPLVAR